jgi:hypothetical protein
MSDVSAQVTASVDKMIISHFMRDFTAQVREDVTFLHSLSAEEKAVFERAGQETRKHALFGAAAAPALLWATKRAIVQFAGSRLPLFAKSGALTAKVLSITAYVAASAIGGFHQAQKAVPSTIQRLVALPPPSTIGARARASVMLVNEQAQAHLPQDVQQEFLLATAKYMRLFPVGESGAEYALKGAADPFLVAEAFRDRLLKKSTSSSTNSTNEPDDVVWTSGTSSISSNRKEQPLRDSSIHEQPGPSDPESKLNSSLPSPADRHRRRSSYDPPRGRDAPLDAPGSKAAEVKPARRVVYNKWGDVVSPDDKDV